MIATTVLLASCGGKDSESSKGSSRQRNAALTSQVFWQRTQARFIASNERLNVALSNENELVAWGANKDGVNMADVGGQPISKAKVVAVGPFGAIAAVGTDDKFYVWGEASETYATPPSGLDLSTVSSLLINYGIAYAIDTNGKLWAWGDAYDNNRYAKIPAEVAAAKIVEAGTYNGQANIAMDDKGKVYTWGDFPGYKSTPDKLKNVVAKHILMRGIMSMVVTTDGKVMQFGTWDMPDLFPGIEIDMVARNSYGATLAVDTSGRLHLDGPKLGNIENDVNQFNEDYGSDGPQVKALSAGQDFFTILMNDGWFTYVSNYVSEATETPDYFTSGRGINPIAAGNGTSFAVGDDYTISTFSKGDTSMTPPSTADFIAVTAGWNHALGLRKNGSVVSWGAGPNDNKIPTFDSQVRQIGAGYGFSAVRTQWGSISEWGTFFSPSKKTAKKPTSCLYYENMDVSFANIIALGHDCDTDKASVVVWGDNTYGQADVPSDIDADQVWRMAVTIDCAAVLMNDGKIRAWGECSGGIKDVPADEQFWTFDLGVGFGVGVTWDDRVVTWGESTDTTLAVPANMPPVARVVAGRDHVLALDYEGGITAWGSNLNGETDVPESFKSVYVPDLSEPDTETDWTTERENIDELEKASNQPVELPTVEDDLTINEMKNGQLVQVPAPTPVTPQPVVPPAEVKTSTMTETPAAKSPGVPVGSTVSTAQAVKILGLSKVSKVSFVPPKSVSAASSKVCSVSKTAVKALGAGICDVKVSFTDSRKKKRTTTLTLIVAS